MMICREDGRKVTEEGKFLLVICRKGIGSNSNPFQFCRCWIHKRCNGIEVN